MPWIISNGKSYVEIIGNNQMITTAYIDRAHTFNKEDGREILLFAAKGDEKPEV